MRRAISVAALLLGACSLDVTGQAFFWPVDGTVDEPPAAEWVDDFDPDAYEVPDTFPPDDHDTADPPLVDTILEVVEVHDPFLDEPPFELVTDPVPDRIEEEIVRPCEPLMGGDCGLVDNCNCGAGMACRVQVDYLCNLYEACVPDRGTLPTDAACSGDTSLDEDPCLPGNICLRSGGPSDYFCFKWCTVNGDCPSNHECTGSVEFWSYECGWMNPDYGVCRWI